MDYPTFALCIQTDNLVVTTSNNSSTMALERQQLTNNCMPITTRRTRDSNEDTRRIQHLPQLDRSTVEDPEESRPTTMESVAPNGNKKPTSSRYPFGLIIKSSLFVKFSSRIKPFSTNVIPSVSSLFKCRHTKRHIIQVFLSVQTQVAHIQVFIQITFVINRHIKCRIKPTASNCDSKPMTISFKPMKRMRRTTEEGASNDRCFKPFENARLQHQHSDCPDAVANSVDSKVFPSWRFSISNALFHVQKPNTFALRRQNCFAPSTIKQVIISKTQCR